MSLLVQFYWCSYLHISKWLVDAIPTYLTRKVNFKRDVRKIQSVYELLLCNKFKHRYLSCL